MKKNNIVVYIKEEFTKRVERKTNWGKNEIMNEFNLALVDASMRVFEELEKANG